MKIVNLSYNTNNTYRDPAAWLTRVAFFVGILKKLGQSNEVTDIHFINFQGQLRIDNVCNHFLRYRKWQLLFPVGFHRYVKKLQPDVVIVQGLIFPLQIILLRWQLGNSVKIILQHQAEKPLRFHKRLFQKLADSYIHAYLFASHEQGSAWVDRRLIKELSKVKEIMGASSTFTPIERRIARSVTNVTGSHAYLWVGRLDGNKDPLTVVKAFRRFLKHRPGATLYMIFQTNELLDKISGIVNDKPNARSAIHLVGKIPYRDLIYWYNSADFIVSGSHYEGSGIAICEAMSCGCIPIVTDIPSFRMMTNQGKAGFHYQAGNEEQLLNLLLESSEMDIECLKNEVLQQFESNLSFDANARKYLEAIGG
jgi:glycosyltransferase involved in cell wall biosynthesis